MSIEVRELEVARSLIRASTKQELNPYGRPYGRAVLVAPEFTHGVWMELFQRTSVERPLRPTEHPNRAGGG
jgi:hypothetical protein